MENIPKLSGCFSVETDSVLYVRLGCSEVSRENLTNVCSVVESVHI